MSPLSAYVLTNNSEKYLSEILESLSVIAEEIVVLDSGSSDQTEAISKSFAKVRWHYRPLDDFKSQRNFAAAACRHDWIVFLDSDEIPDPEFLQSVLQMKAEGFVYDTYVVYRYWYVMGKSIKNIYPVVSPDSPVRLFNRQKAAFTKDSNRVHETLRGGATVGRIGGKIFHRTMHSKTEIAQKLEYYTEFAALDLLERQRTISWWKTIFSPLGAFIKWYGIRGGYRDGWLGLYLGKYAFDYTLKKYRKARRLLKGL